MPVYQACVLVCDGCQAETFGKLVRRGAAGSDAIDVLHPPGWKVGGDKAFCPACPVTVEGTTTRDDVTPVERMPRRAVATCSVCHEPQSDTPSGPTCQNGHGGAPADEPLETIERVAIRFRGVAYSLPPPGRHHDVCHAMHDQGLDGDPDPDPDPFRDQGFLTSRGRFVDRFEAAVLARAAGQIKVKTGPEDELFSEDVW